MKALFVMVTLFLAVKVLSSPSFISVFHFKGQQDLVLIFGTKYNSGSSLAIKLSAHMVYYLMTTIIGMVDIWITGTSFSKLPHNILGINQFP